LVLGVWVPPALEAALRAAAVYVETGR